MQKANGAPQFYCLAYIYFEKIQKLSEVRNDMGKKTDVKKIEILGMHLDN